MPDPIRGEHVFVNCPFDRTYKPIFDAIVFAIHQLRFVPRCALAVDDASEVRLAKIERMIEECEFGIHDISSASLDPDTGLPRFNMPLELGLFLGCKRFGGEPHRSKACLILDRDPYRYRTFISDISGQDIHAHGGQPRQAIIEVRNWLVSVSGRKLLPGGIEIADRYDLFLRTLPARCAKLRRDHASLTFADLTEMIETWLEDNP